MMDRFDLIDQHFETTFSLELLKIINKCYQIRYSQLMEFHVNIHHLTHSCQKLKFTKGDANRVCSNQVDACTYLEMVYLLSSHSSNNRVCGCRTPNTKPSSESVSKLLVMIPQWSMNWYDLGLQSVNVYKSKLKSLTLSFLF